MKGAAGSALSCSCETALLDESLWQAREIARPEKVEAVQNGFGIHVRIGDTIIGFGLAAP